MRGMATVDTREQGAFLPGQPMLVRRMFPVRWNGAYPRAARVRRHPACPGMRASCPHAAVRVRGHLARMQRPGYAGILPARQRSGYAGILPACSGLGTWASCPHAAARVRGHPARMQRCDLSREREHYEDWELI